MIGWEKCYSAVPMQESEPDNTHWYVVAAKARSEAVATANLERQGYSVFLPTIKIKKRRRGRWSTVIEPLFPGYLFIALSLGADDPAPIRSTLGCIGLVRFGQAHIPVPSDLVAALRCSPADDAEATLPFNHGETVHLISGPFSGVEAVFDMAQGQDRAGVLLELLGRVQRLTFNHDDISK